MSSQDIKEVPIPDSETGMLRVMTGQQEIEREKLNRDNTASAMRRRVVVAQNGHAKTIRN